MSEYSQTPLLDGVVEPEKPPAPKSRVRRLWPAVVMGLVIGLGLAIADVPPLPVLTWFLFYYVAIFGHELGHLIAAIWVRFRIFSFTIAGVTLQRFKGRIRWSFQRMFLLGGAVAALPTDDVDLRRRMLILIAGGPVASLLLAAGTLWASGTRPLGIISLCLFVSSVIPRVIAKSLPTDAARFRTLWRGGPAAERSIALQYLVGQSIEGTRSADFDPRKIAAVTALPDGSAEHATGEWLAYYWAMAKGDTASAAHHLESALQRVNFVSERLRTSMCEDAAFLQARFRNNAAMARKWLNAAGRGRVEPYTRLRSEAAVLLSEGDIANARLKAATGLAALKRRWHGGGGLVLEKQWLEDLLAACEQEVSA